MPKIHATQFSHPVDTSSGPSINGQFWSHIDLINGLDESDWVKAAGHITQELATSPAGWPYVYTLTLLLSQGKVNILAIFAPDRGKLVHIKKSFKILAKK